MPKDTGVGRSLPAAATSPHRAHGMNHVSRWQAIRGGDPRITGRTPAKSATLGQELRAGSAMNRAVNTAARRVRKCERSRNLES